MTNRKNRLKRQEGGKRCAVTGRGKFEDPWAFFYEKCGMVLQGGRLLRNRGMVQ